MSKEIAPSRKQQELQDRADFELSLMRSMD